MLKLFIWWMFLATQTHSSELFVFLLYFVFLQHKNDANYAIRNDPICQTKSSMCLLQHISLTSAHDGTQKNTKYQQYFPRLLKESHMCDAIEEPLEKTNKILSAHWTPSKKILFVSSGAKSLFRASFTFARFLLPGFVHLHRKLPSPKKNAWDVDSSAVVVQSKQNWWFTSDWE